MTGDGMRGTQSYPVNYTYTHGHTGYATPLSYVNPSSCHCKLLPYFCWPVYGGVDRGERAISRRPKYRELDHPWWDLFPERRLAYLHLLPSWGPFREMTPVRSPGRWILRHGCGATWQPIQGTVKTCDWHVPHPPLPTLTSTAAINPLQIPGRPNLDSPFALLCSSTQHEKWVLNALKFFLINKFLIGLITWNLHHNLVTIKVIYSHKEIKVLGNKCEEN